MPQGAGRLQRGPSIGSMGLSFLVCLYNLASGGFVLAGAGPLVWKALEVTRLSEVVKVVANAALGFAALQE